MNMVIFIKRMNKFHAKQQQLKQPKVCTECKSDSDFYTYGKDKKEHKLCKKCHYKKYRAEYVKRPTKYDKIDQVKFKEMVASGAKLKDIAEEFNISISSAAKWSNKN